MLERLPEEIALNPIFRQRYAAQNTSNTTEPNPFYLKLVVRHDKDIFYTDGDQIRCSPVHNSGNYSILDNPTGDSEIQHLSLNDLGTFLATVSGTNCDFVTVFALPDVLVSQEGLIRTRPYRLDRIEGGVQKIVWHSAMLHDAGLVVLTKDSKIMLFDLLKPTSKPQLVVDTRKCSLTDPATSISFGSTDALTGSLTLYVSTHSGNIFAIYPFILSLSTISTSRHSASFALNETKDILLKVEKDTGTTQIADTVLKRPLWKSIFEQYTFYSSLCTQIAEASFTTEVRYRNNTYLELAIARPRLPHDFQPEMQGPVFSGGVSIADITHIAPNDKISYLLTVTSDRELVVGNLVNFLPMIMKFGNTHQLNSTAAPSIPTTQPKRKTSGYTKPKKGFGYVEFDDEETTGAKIEPEKQPTKDFEAIEGKYWKRYFCKLTEVGKRRFGVTAGGVSLSTFNSGRTYVARESTKLHVCANSGWASVISQAMDLNEKPRQLPTDTIKEIHVGERIVSLAYVNDRTNVGSPVLLMISASAADSPKVVEIKPRGKEQSDGAVTLVKKSETTQNTEQMLLFQKELFSQLEAELASLKKTVTKMNDHGHPPNLLKHADGPTLKALSELSLTVIEKTIALTAYAVNLKLHTEADIGRLRTQINLLSETKLNSQGLKEHPKEQVTLARLEGRQKELTKRIETLGGKVNEALRNAFLDESMPLSKEEKLWASELNGLNALLDERSKHSFAQRINELKHQVSAIRENRTVSRDESADAFARSQHQMILAKLGAWLNNDLEKMDEVKEVLNDSMRRLLIK